MTTTCLHLVASDSSAVLKQCMAQADRGDTIVLLGEGVLLLTSPEQLQEVASWAALTPDVQARGLSAAAQAAEIRQLGDDELVQLMTTHPFCLTWK